MASTYLSRTLGTSTNTYKGTVSVWLKRSGQGSDQVIYGNYTSGTQRGKLVIAGDGKLMYYQNDGGADKIQLETNRVLRDVGAFYNIVLSVDTTQATASDRVKLYVNGTQETSFSNNSTHNEIGTNQWSLIVLGFAIMMGCSTPQALYLFWDHYKNVLMTPEDTTHSNIRALRGYWRGLDGVTIDQVPFRKKWSH